MTVTMNEKGKYLEIQEISDISYEDDRSAYDSDEEFANFRAVSVSGLEGKCPVQICVAGR